MKAKLVSIELSCLFWSTFDQIDSIVKLVERDNGRDDDHNREKQKRPMTQNKKSEKQNPS